MSGSHTDAGDGAPGVGLSRRTTCVLLLVLAATMAVSYWVEIVVNTFNEPLRVDQVGAATFDAPNFDFFQYYAGGHNWRLGLDPYQNHESDPQALQSPRVRDWGVSGYIYPPTFLPAYAALSRLSYGVARHLWLAFNLVALAAGIAVAALTAKGRRLEVVTAAVLLTMVSYPFLSHVHQGQIDLVVAALTVSAFVLYPRWHGWPSAALLAIAIATKVTPVLVLGVMVLYFRDWRFLLKTLACGAVLFAASLPWTGVALYREYLSTTLPHIAVPDPSRFNQSFLRYLSKTPGVARVVSLGGYAALLLLSFLAGRNSRSLDDESRTVPLQTERYAVLALAVAFLLFFSPLAWQMGYVWMIVPMALLLTARAPAARPRAVLLLAAGAALTSLRVFELRGLNMLNVMGLAVTIVTLMLLYLPLETRESE